jgi:hypothetical protein
MLELVLTIFNLFSVDITFLENILTKFNSLQGFFS